MGEKPSPTSTCKQEDVDVLFLFTSFSPLHAGIRNDA